MGDQLGSRRASFEKTADATSYECDRLPDEHQNEEDRIPKDVEQPRANRDDCDPEEHAQQQQSDARANQPKNPLALTASAMMVVMMNDATNQPALQGLEANVAIWTLPGKPLVAVTQTGVFQHG